MRIALDARTIYRPVRRGTGKNLIDLYRTLAELRPDWRVTAYHRTADADAALLPSPQITPQLIEMPGDRFKAWDRWRLPMAARTSGADVLHCPANHCPPWLPLPTIVTIHDLIPLDMPEGRTPESLQRFEEDVRRACRRASWLICPSTYTRDRLAAEFGADPKRITVNPWAADTSVRPVPRDQWGRVLERYLVDRPFVLHFGAGMPRKNTCRMLEAWALLPRTLREQRQLLVVGLDDAARERFARYASQLDIAGSVALLPFADEHDLPTLMSAADVLAYPSLSEGFGLPILDGWAAGTAVLCSNTTSLPEVAADGAVQVDPTNPAEIAAGLARLMSDEGLRSELIVLGRRRLRRYTWQATAERFIWTIEQAAGLREPRRAAA